MRLIFCRSAFLFYLFLAISCSNLYADPQLKSLEYSEYDSLVMLADTSSSDSLKIYSLLQLASMKYPDDNFQSAIKRQGFLNKATEVAEKSNKLMFLASKADWIGVGKRNRGQYNIALMLHEYALEISEELGNKHQSSIYCNNIGVVYRRIDEYGKAFDYHIRALKLAEEIGDKKSQAIAINSIGNIQMALGNLDDALSYFTQSLKLEKELNNQLGTAINLNNLGNIYYTKKEFEIALEYYRLSLNINKQINSSRGIAICYSDIGKVYQSLDNHDKALDYSLRALSINLNHGDRIFLSDSYNYIGNIYFEEGDFPSALKYIISGLEIAKEIGAKENIMKANLVLYKINKQNGQYKIALQHYDTFHIYKDSIMSISLQKDLARLKISFESERKENLISILEQKSRIDQLEIKKQKIFFWLILSAFIIALGAVTSLVYILYEKNKSNKLLQRKNEEIDRARIKLKKLADDLFLAKQEAVQSNKIKGEFLANISHEIRTPLNSVIGYSDLLSKYNIDSVQKDYLGSIQLSAKSLLVLLNDILDLSKIEAGKIQVNYQAVIVRNLFEELKVIFKNRAEHKSIEFNVSIDEGVPSAINFSDLRLRQIMFNLLGNAIKFTSSGVINVDVRVENERTDLIDLLVEVKDSGQGIPSDEQQNIFEPFYQLGGDNNEGGTGLGLAITKRLVEILKGSISVESNEKEGSNFKVVFSDVEILESDELISDKIIESNIAYEFTTNNQYNLTHKTSFDEFFKNISEVTLDPLHIKKLKNLYLDEFHVARETRLIEKITEFNNILESIAIDTNDDNLKLYTYNLTKLIEQFNIEGIEIYFTQFETTMRKILD